MPNILAFLAPVEDLTELEEIGNRLYDITNETSFDEIFYAPKNLEIRGIRTNELVDYIVRSVDETGDVEYHGIYNDDYIEWQLSPEGLDKEYKIVVTTTVQVFPLI